MTPEIVNRLRYLSRHFGTIGRIMATAGVAFMALITRALDDVNHRIVVTVNGHITLDDILAVMDWQIDERAWTYPLLYDALQADGWPEPPEIARIAEYARTVVKQLGRRGPVAIVTRTAAALETTRHSAIVESEVGPIGFFTTVDAAEAWLRTHTT